MNGQLNLTVEVSAADWGYLQRRCRFLDTVLVRVLRDECGAQEWFSAAELAAMRLPGLPPSREAISRRARSGQWARQRGGPQERGPYRYHVTHLPSRAFDELIRRILDLPPEGDRCELADELADASPPLPPVVQVDNTAPPWVLPLMRLMKGKANGNLGRAWEELPASIPPGVTLPPVEEAAMVLIRLGLAGG